MSNKRLWFIAGTMLLLAAALAACSGQAPAPAGEAPPCPEPEPCPEVPEAAAGVEGVPFQAAWAGSGHADSEAEAFNHWNEDDPAEISTSCAKCHSTPGYLDFLGEDGTEFGVVDNAAPIGTVITCEACHNDTAAALESVVFPSGAEIGGLGGSARCMQCHQGRESMVSVNQAIADLGLEGDPDTPSEELGFVNIHYYAAAASLFGSEAHGGFEYDGKSYQSRFAHVEGYQECIDCHDQHTLQLKVDECAACHGETASEEDLYNIRMNGSLADYDGDGDNSEGIYYEIAGLRDLLYAAIQDYAANVAGKPIAYNAESHPYFFIDTNANGKADEDESVRDNQYNAFTPRLLKAAYNYQVSVKDAGAFAHNAKYHIALLYDSIEDLNTALSAPVDLSAAQRNDPGHFDGTAEAFRHWDEDEPPMVPGSCSRCHSAEGLPLYIAEGVSISQEPANGFMCTTCHAELGGEWPRRAVTEATFPSGAKLSFGEESESNLCIQCHQGRESTVSVNKAIAELDSEEEPDPDTPSEDLEFLNVHYFAAGATLFGTEAKGAYEYSGKTYVGRNEHVRGFQECAGCHDAHELEVNVAACATCHDSEDPDTFRIDPTDWDGDGDTEEGLVGEIETMREALYAALQDYAAETAEMPIVYSSNYPYFLNDTNANGETDPDEIDRANAYATWTPRLLQAAYNYQYAFKDPGAFAHNGKYIVQILYDSIEDIGGDVSGMTRPEVEAPSD